MSRTPESIRHWDRLESEAEHREQQKALVELTDDREGEAQRERVFESAHVVVVAAYRNGDFHGFVEARNDGVLINEDASWTEACMSYKAAEPLADLAERLLPDYDFRIEGD